MSILSNELNTRYVYDEVGGPEVIRLLEEEIPTPGAGEVLLRLTAIGVNPIDTKLRGGVRPSAGTARPLGFDAAGVVVALGVGVSEFQIGQRVAVGWQPGAYAKYLVAPLANLVPLAPSVSDQDAASAGIPCGTAYQALRSLGVAQGDLLLVHGGSGAVGRAAIQFARLAGAEVIASCSPHRAAEVAALGATPVSYGDSMADELAEVLAGRELTVSLDAAGTAQARNISLALIADRSRVATVVQGADADAHGYRGFLGGSAVPLNDLEQQWRKEGVVLALSLAGVGAFTFAEATQLPLADVAVAHEMLEGGASGKIVLLP